jgi:hypothetical protein
MPDKREINEQVARESARRERIGVPVAAAGVLYLVSGIIASATFKAAPTVGLLQGLTPALRGEPNPPLSPRAAEIKYDSHHAFGLIAGSLLTTIAIIVLALVLIFILDAVRFRRPETARPARPLVWIGGIGLAVLSVVNQIVLAIKTHQFAVGHDLTNHAVTAVTHNTLYDILAIVSPLTGIALAAGMVMTMLGAVRVGLLPRWSGMVGGVSALLLLLPVAELDVIPAFWLVSTGILLMGRLPKGDPPAWAAGESRPWPSQAELRALRSGADMAPAMAGGVPEPVRPSSKGSGKRRRKRGSRG